MPDKYIPAPGAYLCLPGENCSLTFIPTRNNAGEREVVILSEPGEEYDPSAGSRRKVVVGRIGMAELSQFCQVWHEFDNGDWNDDG